MKFYIFKIKVIYSFAILAFLFTQNGYGQRVELIGAIGSSHFLGDLGGKPTLGTNDFTDLNLQTTRYVIMGGGRLFFGKNIAIRAHAAYSRVAGDDRFTINIERRGRNLNFYSPIALGAGILEYHIKKKRKGSRGGMYIFAGIETFYFEPKTKFNGQVVNLRPLGTEGQRFIPGRSIYSNVETSIPWGMAYRFPVGRGYLGLELNHRKSFTDYIDDVSTTFVDRNQLYATSGALAVQLSDRSTSTIPGFSSPGAIRGNPRNMDSFFFFVIMYHHPLGKTGYQGSTKGPAGKNRFKKGKCFEF